ncbi:MAG: preprotein translocase subunit SecE [Bacteroidota bacterium]|nr:preprotein translocase subunit SecE [Bacteroidota bacterium]
MFERISKSIELTTDELLNKVTWPTWEELQSSATVVLIASVLIAILVFGIDTILEQLFKIIYGA